jgi:magnesium transporter
VILLPLTLITGIFGMNVQFPGYGTTWAFWGIFAGMVATLSALLAFFRYKRWL